MRQHLKYWCLIAYVIFDFGLVELSAKNRPNVLFICVDDLRTELGCYDQNHIHSPNLDRLASNGFLFTHHYVNIPTCGASRQCLLTGQLPVSLAYIRNDISAKTLAKSKEAATPESFVHHLRRSGYYTVGIGKISHHPDGYVYGYLDEPSNVLELPYSWDEMLLNDDKWGSGHNAFFGYSNGTNRNTLNKEVFPYEMADVPDNAFPDGLTTELAIAKMADLKEKDEPFFLGVGFFKPHLPFTAPKKYWDLYDRNTLPLPPFTEIPENSSKASLQKNGEFNQYKLGEEKATMEHKLSDEYTRKLRHAYFACVSYIDAQIGMLLQALKDQELENNTIVVIWGDHGWHLGDHLVWGKHTLFDRALHSTLIMRVPGMNNGKRISKVVSSTDIYPTLMELCDTPADHNLDGESLVHVMKNPESDEWRNCAYSYWKNGYSVRTPDYRIMQYFRAGKSVLEMYNHLQDPNETRNIAREEPEMLREMLNILEKGNTLDYSKKQ